MKQKELLFILISSSILVFIWIAFSIYHSTTTSTIPEATSIQIVPITPTFNTKTIDLLRQRQKSSPVFELAKPTPTATATTPSASVLTPSPTPVNLPVVTLTPTTPTVTPVAASPEVTP